MALVNCKVVNRKTTFFSFVGFRAHVWQILAETVGPGEIITYGSLAARLRNPGKNHFYTLCL